MKRRAFLSAVAAGSAAPFLPSASAAAPSAAQDEGRILTVSGPIAPSALGATLVHEHVLVDFGGAATASRSRYDAGEVFRTALPQLTELRARGCGTLVDCTPAYLGRDPLLLRRLSTASGLRILTNTGYYGALQDRFLPPHAFTESARQLADRWTAEFRQGIEGTGIRPGFIKVGVDAGPLSGTHRKLVEAGALCHLDTGLTLAVHTGDGDAALGIFEVLKTRGVSPEALIWVHAQNAKDKATRSLAAGQGAWIELDNLGPKNLDEHVAAVLDLRDRLDRVLVSQDAGWYHVGEPGGGTYRPYTFLFDAFVPALRARGFGEAEVSTLLVDNPARALSVRRRAATRGA